MHWTIATLLIALPPFGAAPAPFAAQTAPAVAQITVTVPHDEAELLVDGASIAGRGRLREIEVRGSAADGAREHQLTVIWQPNSYTAITRRKSLRVEYGTSVRVDLTSEEPDDLVEVRYVPTPHAVVLEMIDAARLTSRDVVFDLGCGDGRILVAAVAAGAARGVGVDLDPRRVAEASANARAAGLGGRVAVREGNALEVDDLGQATVVFLYMGEEFNERLRPLLWRDLPVGARVVSHRFGMGDWAPDRSIDVMLGDGPVYAVHVWTITDAVKRKAGS